MYCLDCRRFLSDRFIVGVCPRCVYDRARGDQCENCTTLLDPSDLRQPRCAICGQGRIEARESRHLFLMLPKLTDRVAAWVNGKDGYWPNSTLGVAHKWLDEGLRERCITRDLSWGIPVPLPGFENKVFYVWFDAPIGYIGISMEWAEAAGNPDAWQTYWKDPDTRLVQFLGKDNVPFHAVTWPATMMGADDGFVLADMIKSFEFLNYEGGKFSTSRGRGIFTDQALDLFPADVWRYCLCVLAPERKDTDFSWDSFETALNKDLADVLGNFVNRTITFVQRYFDGKVPPAQPDGDPERGVKAALEQTVREGREAMAGYWLGKAVRAVRDFWAECNRYFDARAPWQQRKTDLAAAGSTLNCSAHLARAAAILAAPFIPHTAEGIFGQLRLDPASVHRLPWATTPDFGELTGRPVGPAVPLFQKVEPARLAEVRQRFAGQAGV
jgi:methionyl-tRNA synthetase